MRQKKASTSDRLAEKQKRRSVRPYKIVSALSALLFLGLVSYMIYFQMTKSNDLLNSSYNKRTAALAEQVIRGEIRSSDGAVLARTDTDSEGDETRVYPYGSLFAHTVGYLEYGSSGLELSENSRLYTSHLNLGEQVIQDIKEEKKPGDNVITTLDLSLQQTANDALSGFSGAVFAMRADTGEVLVDVSRPAYDPNTIVSDWAELTSEENESSGIFMNRATQGLYPPGSTFKIVTALAYLRTYGSFEDFSFDCTGSYESGGFTIHCINGTAHGREDFRGAMANSCNCAFAHMAAELIENRKLKEVAEGLGFNKKIELSIPSAKSRFTLDKNETDPLTMQTAIGQGNTVASPMEMCLIADAIANRGEMMRPGFVKRIENANGTTVRTISPASIGRVMTAQEADSLTEVMRAVVTDGTASALSALSVPVAGKTGTAQYGDVSEGKSHSWFTGFSMRGHNDMVICVLVEDGGGKLAAHQVAQRVFEAFFAQDPYAEEP